MLEAHGAARARNGRGSNCTAHLAPARLGLRAPVVREARLLQLDAGCERFCLFGLAGASRARRGSFTRSMIAARFTKRARDSMGGIACVHELVGAPRCRLPALALTHGLLCL